MTLYDISEHEEPWSDNMRVDLIRVSETHIGKGVFAVRPYPATAVIGRITGQVMDDPNHGSEYSYEYRDGLQLEPDAPFRYVNHSCDPNCEFDLLEEPAYNGEPAQLHLCLIALRDVQVNEQLTIEYNWSAASAIECECGAENCVGWIVCKEELEAVLERNRSLESDAVECQLS